jgi:chromosome segregation ATPase
MDDAQAKAVKQTLAHYRGDKFAKWVTVTLGLAAMEHPKAMRHALSSVFETEKIEQSMDLAASRLAIIQDELGGLRDTIAQLTLENKRLSDDYQRIEMRLQKAGQYATQLEKRMEALSAAK